MNGGRKMVDKEMMEKNTRNRKPLPIGVSDFKEIVEKEGI